VLTIPPETPKSMLKKKKKMSWLTVVHIQSAAMNVLGVEFVNLPYDLVSG
jgi:hypothetical protein